MQTKTMKWVSIVALLFGIVSWPASSNYQTELNLVVCVGAALVAVQAYKAMAYRWAAGFLAIGFLFNPLFPMFRLAGLIGLALLVFALGPFAISLAAFRTAPLLSIPSITDRTPGSQSL